MGFSLQISPQPAFLLVEAAGPMNLGDLCGMFDLAAKVCEMNGHRRVLFNLVETRVDLSFTQHLHLGSHAAHSLRQLERAASVVSAASRRGTSEKSAQKHGLTFRTFTDYAEGEEWVAAPDAAGTQG